MFFFFPFVIYSDLHESEIKPSVIFFTSMPCDFLPDTSLLEDKDLNSGSGQLLHLDWFRCMRSFGGTEIGISRVLPSEVCSSTGSKSPAPELLSFLLNLTPMSHVSIYDSVSQSCPFRKLTFDMTTPKPQWGVLFW